MIVRELVYKDHMAMRRWLKKYGYISTSNVSKNEFTRIVKLVTHKEVNNKTSKYILHQYILEHNSYRDCYLSKKQRKAKDCISKKLKVVKKDSSDFYSSREWREVRLKALIQQGRRCCVCGRSGGCSCPGW